MALPILGPALGFLGSIFFRKVTEAVTGTDASDLAGSHTTTPPAARRKPRALTKPFFYVVGAVCLYYFIIYPVISYHWPHYNFPPIEATLLNVLFSLGGMGGAQ